MPPADPRTAQGGCNDAALAAMLRAQLEVYPHTELTAERLGSMQWVAECLARGEEAVVGEP
jgi:hypothetical protein